MADQVADRTIVIHPSTVARTLAVVAALLLIASTIGQLIKHNTGHGRLYGLVYLTYVDGEQNIPTLFAVFLLLLAATVLLVITIFKRRESDRFRWGWLFLFIGFCAMAADEAFALHERLIEPGRALMGEGKLGILFFGWVVFAAGLVGAIGIAYLKFLLHLPSGTRREFIVAAALFLSGAIGAELLGGKYAETHGLDTLTFSVLATTEEALEMAGLIVFIYALLKYFANRYGDARFLCPPAAAGS